MGKTEAELSRPAVFLDRDGVLVEDTGVITHSSMAHPLPGVAEALMNLHKAGALLVVVSNQSVLARGLLDEEGVIRIQRSIEDKLMSDGAPRLDGFYFCGHHPHADLEVWRSECDCRKPAPGLLLKAAKDLEIDLTTSFMVGDRPSDITAGHRAGCRTILVETGRHTAPPILTWQAFDPVDPDVVCKGLKDASRYILEAAKW